MIQGAIGVLMGHAIAIESSKVGVQLSHSSILKVTLKQEGGQHLIRVKLKEAGVKIQKTWMVDAEG